MKKPTFISESFEVDFNNNGYIIIKNFLNKEELNKVFKELNNVYDKNYIQKVGMWNSLYNLSKEEGIIISEFLLELLKPKLKMIVKDFKVLVATFMVKNPNKNSASELHKDFFIDESKFEYRNFWIPLVDINYENEMLYVIPKSHKVFNYPQPMFVKWPYKSIEETIMKQAVNVMASAGDLVVYADRTLHGSYINYSKEARPVIHFGALHTDANLSYYKLNSETNKVSVFDVPFSFYFENRFELVGELYEEKRNFEFLPPSITL